MLHFVSGDMFEVSADVRVNTVNCVGVMGAGVALAFKNRYPAMFRAYKAACVAQEVKPGALNIWRTLDGVWIINFPTKRHWRDRSRYEDIGSGLVALRAYLRQHVGVRVTLPALGCGHGGLEWKRVSAMIRQHLDGLDAEVFVFQPKDSRREAAHMETVFTIGHSRHTPDHFLALLRASAIGQLVDVRSQPCSKWAPHFDKAELSCWLGAAGVDYVFLGRQLGGRPEERAFYRHDGTVDYALRSEAIDFVDGIARLVTLSQDRKTVVLCAEEDPAHCHRRLLITPALVHADTTVVHMRGDGRLEQDHAPPAAPTQLDLFGNKP